MDSLERYGKLLMGTAQDAVPFAINLDYVVYICVLNDHTNIVTTIDLETTPSFKLPEEWYETILGHWKDYCVYGG